MQVPVDFGVVDAQTSNVLTCPLRCVAPSKVIANAAVRKLIHRFKVLMASGRQNRLEPTQGAGVALFPLAHLLTSSHLLATCSTL